MLNYVEPLNAPPFNCYFCPTLEQGTFSAPSAQFTALSFELCWALTPQKVGKNDTASPVLQANQPGDHDHMAWAATCGLNLNFAAHNSYFSHQIPACALAWEGPAEARRVLGEKP